jgi:serine/threonine protein kinase
MLEPQSQPPDDARLSWMPRAANPAEVHIETMTVRHATLATNPPRPDDVAAAADTGEEAELPYRFCRRIGIGGMGEVWLGFQESLGRTVAIKRVRQDRIAHVDATLRRVLECEFRNEALAAAALEHPNIAPVYDFGSDDAGDPMMAMKLVKGRPWDGLLFEDRGKLSTEDFLGKHLPILISMGQAVAYAHAHGIVHRDLKPSQVMVGEFGEALLMDWGLAMRIGTPPAEDEVGPATRSIASLPTPSTATNPAGTPALMAPEQTVLDASNVGTHTDVFLLGGTLYFLLTGYYPNESEDGRSAIEMARTCSVPRPETRAPGGDTPKELADLAMAAMVREPEKRVPSAREFVSRIQSYLSGEGRRRVASERVEEACLALKSEARSYTDLSRALASLEEARRHWPAHPAIEPLREETLVGQAELALREGDLAFARIQAASLPRGDRRDSLLTEVTREQSRRDRNTSNLRAAGIGVVLLALIVAGVSTVFARSMQSKNEELALQKTQIEEQKGIAETKRAEAEQSRAVALAQYKGTGGLVAFMLGDLNRKLDMQLPHDQEVAKTVAEGTSKYYRGIDTKSLDDELLAEHATQLLQIAKAYRELGLYESGKETANQARMIRTQLHGEEAVEVGEVLSIEGVLTMQLGGVDDGMAELRRGVELLDGKIPEEDDRFVIALGNLGEALASQGKPTEGVAYIRRAIAIREAKPGGYPLQMNSLKHNLAATLINLNELEEAEEVIDSLEADILDELGPDTISMSDLLYMRANLWRVRGESAETILVVLQRALDISMSVRGADHPMTQTLKNNAAIMKQRSGRVDEALQEFIELYDIRRTRFGTNHPDTAIAMNNIGNIYSGMGDNVAALDWLGRARAAYIATVGPDHVDIAPIEGNIGLIYAEMGRFEEGVAPIEHALAVRTEAFGPRHPATLNSRAKKLMLQIYWARHEDAATTLGSSLHWQEALDVMADFVEEAMSVAPVTALLAEARLRTGDREGALEAARAAAMAGYGANPTDHDQVVFSVICDELEIEKPWEQSPP